MSYSRRSRYSLSPSPPPKRYGRPVSRSPSSSTSRSRSRLSSDAENPGNNLYVTGISSRVTERQLERHFASEGTVEDINLVLDPWSRQSRGFGFVTMSSVKEADRCIKYLNNSVLEGRVITVEKFLLQQARRKRGRTPTPGRYLGLRTVRAQRRSSNYSPDHRRYSRSPQYSSERSLIRSRSRSRSYSPHSRRRRSYSPYYRRRRERSYSRSPSPYYRRRRERSFSRTPSPYYRCERERSFSRSPSPYSRSPVTRRDVSYPPYHHHQSPDNSYRRSSYRHRYCSVSRSPSPRRRRYSRRSYSSSISRSSCSGSVSPQPRRSRRSYSRSVSPRRSHRETSFSPRPRGGGARRIARTHASQDNCRSSSTSQDNCRSSSRSTNASRSSRSFTRSVTPESKSP